MNYSFDEPCDQCGTTDFGESFTPWCPECDSFLVARTTNYAESEQFADGRVVRWWLDLTFAMGYSPRNMAEWALSDLYVLGKTLPEWREGGGALPENVLGMIKLWAEPFGTEQDHPANTQHDQRMLAMRYIVAIINLATVLESKPR